MREEEMDCWKSPFDEFLNVSAPLVDGRELSEFRSVLTSLVTTVPQSVSSDMLIKYVDFNSNLDLETVFPGQVLELMNTADFLFVPEDDLDLGPGRLFDRDQRCPVTFTPGDDSSETFDSANSEFFLRHDADLKAHNQTDRVKITIKHACTIQKSYSNEKRFLCPPLHMQIEGNLRPKFRVDLADDEADSLGQLWFTIHFPATDEKLSFEEFPGKRNETHTYFRKIYVNDTLANPKDKSMTLDVKLETENSLQTIVSVPSAPIQILSKPSRRKLNKTPEMVVESGDQVALFHRVKAQSLTTRYLTVSENALSCDAIEWGQFRVWLVHDARLWVKLMNLGMRTMIPWDINSIQDLFFRSSAEDGGCSPNQDESACINYGDCVILEDEETGFVSAPMKIHATDDAFEDITQDQFTPIRTPLHQLQKFRLEYFESSGKHLYVNGDDLCSDQVSVLDLKGMTWSMVKTTTLTYEFSTEK